MNMEELLAALRALIESAEAEDRPLTDEELERAAALEAQIEAWRLTDEAQRRARAYGTPQRNDLHVSVGGSEEVSEHLRAFHQYAVTGDGAQLRAITTTVDAAGGYLVPDSTSTKIVERLKAFGGLQNEAEQITTTTGERMLWATEDDTANTAEIVPEGEAADTAGADKVFGQASLDVYKYEATGADDLPMKVSWEFLTDSPINFENHIADNFARRIARKFAVDIVTGSGTGEPLGITSKAEFDEIAANATGPTFGELVGAVAALDPEYYDNAKWLMAPSTWWFLVTNLVDANDRPLLQAQAASGLSDGFSMNLLGFPVVLDPAMPAIGDNTKPIIFGDLRQSYIVRRVGGFSLLRLNELYAINGFVGFLGWARMGGTVQNLNSYVVLGSENVA